LVRRPYYKEANFGGPVTATEAFGASPRARIGHLNDCFLASDNDFGTYRAPGDEGYVTTDTRFVAMAGETCAPDPPRSSCESAKRELARHHFSFLNRDYHKDVVDSWRADGCYDEIACRLGYRFVVEGFAVPKSARPGGVLPISITMFNDGYARAVN